MAGFESDIFKASVLAKVPAILLGATTYVLSPQIETAPTPVVTVDAYTEKGGYGPSMASSFYLYKTNISIFANVKDPTNKPCMHALLNATLRMCVHP